MSWLWLLFAAYLLYIGSSFYNLLLNYLKARKTGFPLVICPINPNHPIWMIASVPLRPVLKRFLPDKIFHRLNLSIYGWEFVEKCDVFQKYGKCFMYVTCGRNELAVADAEVAAEVLKRPKDFIQTDAGSLIAGAYGQNLITSDGDSWARQRKFIAPNINERVSNTVFQESCRQTREMMDGYMQTAGGTTNDIANGMKTIAINVLGKAGYGVERSFNSQDEKPPAGFHNTYIEVCRMSTDHLMEAALLPRGLLTWSVWPKVVQKIGHAIREFPIYTTSMIEAERKRYLEDGQARNNILSMLVKEQASGSDEKGNASQKLTADETMGNLFVFTAAGFETTAHTMAFAIVLLILNPEWQTWICEEVDEVLKNKPEELDYVEVFPKMTRLLAVMHETLRLFAPLVHLAKMTSDYTTLTTTSSTTGEAKTYTVPPRAYVYVSSPGLHYDTTNWGADAASFVPTRWLTTNPETGKPGIITPTKGTFVPWSNGPRVCPGSKMSQVEFVSVFMTIFRRYIVEPVRKEGDSMEGDGFGDARKRLTQVLQDSEPRMTLCMKRPKDVELRFVERKAKEQICGRCE